MAADDIVIAAYAETKIELKSGRSAYEHAGDAFDTICGSTGLTPREIDGLSVTMPISEAGNVFFAPYLADTLGLMPRWLNASALGGCSAISGVARARDAIRGGACKIVLVISADAQGTSGRSRQGAYRPEFSDPQGIEAPPAAFGLLMSRYAHQHGDASEALCAIALAQRKHGCLNPNAVEKLRRPLTREDYLASRVIADPLRMLDCVMVCDGANALLLTTEAEAKARGWTKRVHPRAYAEITNYAGDDPCADVTRSGFWAIGPEVLARSGVRPADIGSFQPYDDFTIAVLMQMEAFGFCREGQGRDFVRDTDLSFRGSLPLNTGGGQISAGQPGLAGGGLNLVEGVRQLFGEAEGRQVSGARTALVTGIGTIPYGRNWSTSAALVLEA